MIINESLNVINGKNVKERPPDNLEPGSPRNL